MTGYPRRSTFLATWREHWPEYLSEALGLGLFMISATAFAVLLFHPASPLPHLLPSMMLRGSLMGLAMGLTALGNIHSPWGRRSGAHLNPSVTLTFVRLGKVSVTDAAGYVAAQFVGAAAGMGIGVAIFHRFVSDPSVNFVATLPGMAGRLAAFGAETAISFLLMLAVLVVSGTARTARHTGIVAATLVAIYIALETPISGMSMNPARTLGSALYAGKYTALWLYFIAPPFGMLLAAECWRGIGTLSRSACAKLDHDARYRCIFCGHEPMTALREESREPRELVRH